MGSKMANLFKVRLSKTSEDFEELFDCAFRDIYALSKKICDSEDTMVKDYLYACDPWMRLDGDTITFEVDGYVEMNRNDVRGRKQVEYDFGKRSPTDDSFIFAIMCIFYHYIPGTEFYCDVEPYDDCFDDGVILARLVNDKIENPFVGALVPVEKLITNRELKNIYFTLSGTTPQKTVRFYP
jgi:hypothetical protein